MRWDRENTSRSQSQHNQRSNPGEIHEENLFLNKRLKWTADWTSGAEVHVLNPTRAARLSRLRKNDCSAGVPPAVVRASCRSVSAPAAHLEQALQPPADADSDRRP